MTTIALVTSADGHVIAGRRADGAGPTLLLLHGASDTHETWDAVIPHLAGRSWVAPSLPGRRGSHGPPCASAAEAAAVVTELARALGLREVVAVGHSYGGAVALELALGPLGAAHVDHAGVADGGPRLVGLALVASGARLRVHPTILAAAATGGALARGAPDVDDATVLADWRAADAFDRIGALDALALPSLVLVGTRDALTPPKYADYLAAHLRDVERVTLDGAAHFLQRERPDAVAAALVAFAERLAATPSGGDQAGS